LKNWVPFVIELKFINESTDEPVEWVAGKEELQDALVVKDVLFRPVGLLDPKSRDPCMGLVGTYLR
jgi:hypothetical protein